MGLTIYYELGNDDISFDQAHELLQQLRTKALSLSFAEVGEIETFDRQQTAELKREAETDHGASMFLWQASSMAQDEELLKSLGEDGYHTVQPESFHRFVNYPGDGCETAVMGLSRLPTTTLVKDREWPTGLPRWHWHSFCKTQYASNPKHGGIDHFLRCHLGLIELLDYADELNILKRVGDDTGFWDHRDESKLRESVEDMNRMIASFVGAFKDKAAGKTGDTVAPITDYPNFEHLEADQHVRRDKERNDE